MVPAVETSIAWIDSGTEFFLDRAAAVDLAAPSALPDWTNGHVVAHVARNAEGLGRLLTWVRTGVETPMYASVQARAADIERDAGRPRDVQLADLSATAAELSGALDAIENWAGTARMLSGREVAGAEVAWLRVKELWLHAVDIGADIADLPYDFVDAALLDVTGNFDAREDTPSLRLIADSGAEYTVHGGDTEVRGTAGNLLAWLTGRPDTAGLPSSAALPALPNWA